MRYLIGALLALAMFRWPAQAFDTTAKPPNFLEPAYGQSLFFFGGLTSRTDIWSTAALKT